MEELHFIYINAKGQINAHTAINVSYSENHIQGICTKAHQLKTYRKDRILKQFNTTAAALAALGNYSKSDYTHLITPSSPRQKETFDICFTGFKKIDKERLTECALANGLMVRSSVTRNLQILCCGYNAGPTKVTAARMQGVVILDEVQFEAFLETGEIPDIGSSASN